MQSYLIGNLAISGGQESDTDLDVSTYSSPFMDLERNLAVFLGLHCNRLVTSTPLQESLDHVHLIQK